MDPPCIAIVTLSGGLAYAPTAVLPASARRGAAGLWTEEGSAHGYGIYVPRRPGTGALGIWFNPGRLGALFFPERRADSIVYRNLSAEDFKRALVLDFGVEVEELGFD